MKYALYIDYTIDGDYSTYTYCDLAGKNLVDALDDAERAIRTVNNDPGIEIYLSRILQKVDGLKTGNKTWEQYKAILCKRSAATGWHKNTMENMEQKHIVQRIQKGTRKNPIVDWYREV